MTAVLLLVVSLCVALPGAYAVALVPAFWLLERLFIEPGDTIMTVGPMDVTVGDIGISILLGKLLFDIARRRSIAAERRLYAMLGIFLYVNLLATFVAGVKFGESHLLGSAIALARVAALMMLVPITAQAMKTVPQARHCLWILLGTLGVLAAIQFVNFFGASRGIIIGEVQGLERGEVRYFGPVGDSVGFVLLLGYLVALCFGSLAGAGAFLGAILLTAGLGAIFATALGSAFFLLAARHAPAFAAAVRRRMWLLPTLLAGGMVAGVLYARPFIGPLLDRVATGSYTNSTEGRIDSARSAVAMILDNPLFGVGYMGYERSLERYGGDQFFDLSKPSGSTANANNQVLQTLTDSGLPGLVVFVGLIVSVGRSFLTIAARHDEPFFSAFYLGALIWLLALAFGNLGAVWLLPSFGEILLWILLGISVALPRLLAKQTPREGVRTHRRRRIQRLTVA
ncbi:MAG: O-antigen ligase family protein [Vicinamibacterales bacterium]